MIDLVAEMLFGKTAWCFCAARMLVKNGPLILGSALGRKIAPPHGGFESRFEYGNVEFTSTTRTKLLNLRVNLRVDS